MIDKKMAARGRHFLFPVISTYGLSGPESPLVAATMPPTTAAMASAGMNQLPPLSLFALASALELRTVDADETDSFEAGEAGAAKHGAEDIETAATAASTLPKRMTNSIVF